MRGMARDVAVTLRAGRCDCSGVQRARHGGRRDRFGGGEAIDRDHGRVGGLAQELQAERRQHLPKRSAILRIRQVGRDLQAAGALGDAGDQHLVLVADLVVEHALKPARASRFRAVLARGKAAAP